MKNKDPHLYMDCTSFGGFFEERQPVNGKAHWRDRSHKPPGSGRLAKNGAGGGSAKPICCERMGGEGIGGPGGGGGWGEQERSLRDYR